MSKKKKPVDLKLVTQIDYSLGEQDRMLMTETYNKIHVILSTMSDLCTDKASPPDLAVTVLLKTLVDVMLTVLPEESVESGIAAYNDAFRRMVMVAVKMQQEAK